MDMHCAKFAIGQVVRHRVYPFRGVIFDVDPTFSNTEEYWLSIPENIRPHKDQPFYHLLAENDESAYVAYVSEQNLVPDDTGQPVGHPQASMLFEEHRRLGVPHGLARIVGHKVLLRDIGYVGAFIVLSEEMIERLVLMRADVLRNRQPVFLGVRERRIDVEDHAAKWIDAVTHDLADRKFGAVHVHPANLTQGS